MSKIGVCPRCGREAAYHRRYSGEILCRSCFSDSIVEKVERTISKYKMFRYGDRIGVAVSGGKDSLSLLRILEELSSRHGSKLFCITIDEGIRGYRDEAVQNSINICKELDIPIHISSYKELFGYSLDEALDWRVPRKVSSCSICGILRRRAIDLAASQLSVDVVATAHNLDDLLQTFFINIFNGDVDRLRWLNPDLENRGLNIARRVKPFMEIYEQEIAFYAYLNRIPFQSRACPYMKEGIRSEIRSFLNSLEEEHSGIKYSILHAILNLIKGLKIDIGIEAKKCSSCGSPCSGEICSVCQTLQLIKLNSRSLSQA